MFLLLPCSICFSISSFIAVFPLFTGGFEFESEFEFFITSLYKYTLISLICLKRKTPATLCIIKNNVVIIAPKFLKKLSENKRLLKQLRTSKFVSKNISDISSLIVSLEKESSSITFNFPKLSFVNFITSEHLQV